MYSSIQNVASQREKKPWLRGGLRTDGFMVGLLSDHGRIGRALEMTFPLFSPNFSQILKGDFSWQAQYLVRLEGDTCYSTHCK